MITRKEMIEYLQSQDRSIPSMLTLRESYAVERAINTNYLDKLDKQELRRLASDLEISLNKCVDLVNGACGELILQFIKYF